MVKELMHTKSWFRETSIARFVREKIRGVEAKATVDIKNKLSQALKNLPKRKVATPVSNSPKKRQGSTDGTSELAPAHQTLVLHSGRDEPLPELKKKKSSNAQSHRSRSKNGATLATTNNVCFRKKNTYSPYR